MVVGPQQHWLHLNQGTFREWWLEEQFEIKMKEKMASMAPHTPTKLSQKQYLLNNQIATPPNGSRRSPLGEVDNEQRNSIGVQEDCLPAPTPGQPRKTSRAVDRHHPYSRNISYSTTEDEHMLQRETEMISIHRSSNEDPDGEDEIQFRMRTSRKSSRSPAGRSISQTTTTIYSSIDNDSSNDIENLGSGSRPKTPAAMKSGSGSNTLAKVRGSPKRSGDSLRGSEKPAGVRKTSGRVGSISSSRKVSGL